MAHVYKVSQWQSSSGRWYCNDVADLAGLSAQWWMPARLLGVSLCDYILLLKDKFNVNYLTYNEEKDVLIFSWDKETDCHKYVLWINSMARKANFLC